MIVTRRPTFRLYPTPQQAKQWHDWRKLDCSLYNAAVANRKTQDKHVRHAVDDFEQQNSQPAFKRVWPECAALGSQALQAPLQRVDFACQHFFKRQSGDPPFKSSHDYREWTSPAQSGWQAHTNGANRYLERTHLGGIQRGGKARTWGTPTTGTIIFAQGQWYASITVQCPPQRELGTGVIGAGFGCKTTVALSNGETIEAPKAEAQEKINPLFKQQRRTSQKRKVKATHRWRKIQAKLRRVERHHWGHEVAADLTSRHSIVVTEKINLKGMTRQAKKGEGKHQKTGLNRSLWDVGLGMLKDWLKYKLVEGNGFLIHAPTRHLKPTQRYAKCWERPPKPPADRWHVCAHPACGHVKDRNLHSAQVCETGLRSQELASLVAELPRSTSWGSMKPLGAQATETQGTSEFRGLRTPIRLCGGGVHRA